MSTGFDPESVISSSSRIMTFCGGNEWNYIFLELNGWLLCYDKAIFIVFLYLKYTQLYTFDTLLALFGNETDAQNLL